MLVVSLVHAREKVVLVPISGVADETAQDSWLAVQSIKKRLEKRHK